MRTGLPAHKKKHSDRPCFRKLSNPFAVPPAIRYFLGAVNCFGLIFGGEGATSFATQLFWDLGYIGLFLIVVQAILTLVVGHHGDMDGAADGLAWGDFISLKTIAAMCLGIGFGGAAFGENGFSALVAMAGGVGIGLVLAAFFVAVMRGLHRLRSDGTAQLWEAIGQRATVYLRIPGQETAAGEIQVAFGGRLMNIPAFTRGPEIPTGTDVLVISVHGEHALEVEKISDEQLKLK